MARSSFKIEIHAWLLLSFALAMTESGVLGFIAKKYFEGTVENYLLDWTVGIIAAAPAFANIVSFIFAKISTGKEKIPFIFKMQLIVCFFVMTSALLPKNQWGLLMLILLPSAGSRIAWSAIATLRTGIWRANYPAKIRAQVTSRIAVAQGITLAAVAFTAGVVLSLSPEIFRFLIPACGAVGIIGAFKYKTIRMRKGAKLLSQEVEKIKNKQHQRTSLKKIMADHKDFLFYMSSMFLFGLGNIMVGAPLLIILNDKFNVTYLLGISLTTVIPTALMATSAPLWSKIFDSMDVIQFRRIHCWCFLASTFLMLIGAYHESLQPFALALIFRGIGFGGGVIAWNLGHHDFATSENSTKLMSTHVTLTGIRGLIAPLVGVGLYEYATNNLNDLYGFWVFSTALAISSIGSAGFFLQKTRKNTSSR